ncbi:MAG: hypothetical protein IPO35_10895 [Uliginosibacterium sp.]|nr:hypothetical protein [Uliginosibacterium sp.]
MTLISGAWLTADSARFATEQHAYQALDAVLTDLHGLHDAQLDIESAYRGTLMTGSGKALEELRLASSAGRRHSRRREPRSPRSPGGERDIEALDKRMIRHFLALETQLQSFRGGADSLILMQRCLAQTPAARTACWKPRFLRSALDSSRQWRPSASAFAI